jgi:hypothetical protein
MGWTGYSTSTSTWDDHLPGRPYTDADRVPTREGLDGHPGQLWLNIMLDDFAKNDPSGWDWVNLLSPCPLVLLPVEQLWRAFTWSLFSGLNGCIPYYLSSVFSLAKSELQAAGYQSPLEYFGRRVRKVLDAVCQSMRPESSLGHAHAGELNHNNLVFPLCHVHPTSHGTADWGDSPTQPQPYPAAWQFTCMPWHTASPAYDHDGAAKEQAALLQDRADSMACASELSESREALEVCTTAFVCAYSELTTNGGHAGAAEQAAAVMEVQIARVALLKKQLDALFTARTGRRIWLHSFRHGTNGRLVVDLGSDPNLREGVTLYVHRLVCWATYGPPQVSLPAALDLPLGRDLFVMHLCGDEACFQPQHLVFGCAKYNTGKQERATAYAMWMLLARRLHLVLQHAHLPPADATRLRTMLKGVLDMLIGPAPIETKRPGRWFPPPPPSPHPLGQVTWGRDGVPIPQDGPPAQWPRRPVTVENVDHIIALA